KGQFVLADASRTVDWSKQISRALIRTKLPPFPRPPQRLMKIADAKKWEADFWQSEPGRARALAMKSMRSFPLSIQTDGSFTIEDVSPGAYQLSAALFDAPFDHGTRPVPSGKPLASIQQDVVVPDSADNQSADTLDIGDVVVTIAAK